MSTPIPRARLLLLALAVAACAGSEARLERRRAEICAEVGAGFAGCRAVLPADDATAALQGAFLAARPGEVVALGEGTYGVLETLSLATDDVTIRGAGRGRTVLDFSRQRSGSGGDGLVAKVVDGFTLEGVSVRDTLADGVRVEKSRDVVLRDVGVSWTGLPDRENGLYGLYPVGCENVLVEGSEVSGATDGGIYLGETTRAVVRGNRLHGNVVGVQVENSYDVDVHDNLAEDNSVGLAFFNVPGRLVNKGGRRLRAFANRVAGNNHPNVTWNQFPRGVGVLVIAAQDVEVRDNEIRDHDTAHVAVLSHVSLREPWDDPGFATDAQRVAIDGNRFAGASRDPDVGRIVGRLVQLSFPEGAPAIVADNVSTPLDGAPAGNPGWICVGDGDGASFAVLDSEPLDGAAPSSRDDGAPFDCELPPLPPVELAGGLGGNGAASGAVSG